MPVFTYSFLLKSFPRFAKIIIVSAVKNSVHFEREHRYKYTSGREPLQVGVDEKRQRKGYNSDEKRYIGNNSGFVAEEAQ